MNLNQSSNTAVPNALGSMSAGERPSRRTDRQEVGTDTPVLLQTQVDSPVGTLQLIASDAGIRALLWQTDDTRVHVGLTELVDPADHPVLLETEQQLEQYFAGTLTKFDLLLDPVGTPFQLDAWRELSNIAYGKTASYAEQATKIGRPKAVRAVGAANGKNPISIIVPCHRVIGSNGSLTGFAAGVDAKRWLLDHERRVAGESLF
jgi:methylated-DNA-[protein]-cysteine S-methyltransferase